MALEGEDEEEEHVLVVVDVHSVCRFCLGTGGALSEIFDETIDSEIVTKLASFAHIEIQPDANLPSKVCHRCRHLIEMCYEFWSLILQSHKTLTENVDNGNDDSSQMQVGSESDCSSIDIINDDPSQMRDDSESDCSLIDVVNDDPNTEQSPDIRVYETYSNDDSNMINNYTKNTLDLDKNIVNKGQQSVNMESELCRQNYDTKTLDDPPSKIINKFPAYNPANERHSCLLCLEKYKDKASLKNHIDSHFIDTDLKPYYLFENDYTCNVCKEWFPYRCQLIVHQRIHLKVKPYKCMVDGCKDKFISGTALRHHLSNHSEKNFICSICPVRFKCKSDLTNHELMHKDEGAQYVCPLCKLVCKNRFTRAAHMRKHKKQPMFTCKSCPKKFFSPSELARHECIHDTSKPFQCDKCHMAYYSLSALYRHLKSCHENNDEEMQCMLLPTCTLCCQEHERIPYAIRMKWIGTCEQKEFPIRCDECYRGFFEEICFQTHIDTCNSELTSQLLEDVNELIAMDEEHNIL